MCSAQRKTKNYQASLRSHVARGAHAKEDEELTRRGPREERVELRFQRVEPPVEGHLLRRRGGRLLAREPLVRDARDAALAHGARERDLERRPDAKPMNEFVELLEAGRRDDLDELRGVQYE